MDRPDISSESLKKLIGDKPFIYLSNDRQDELIDILKDVPNQQVKSHHLLQFLFFLEWRLVFKEKDVESEELFDVVQAVDSETDKVKSDWIMIFKGDPKDFQ